MITIVIGKPGTGKSYHTTRYIANYLTTLARKQTLDRKIFTNLSVNIDEFQKYFDRRKISINVADVLIKLDGEELKYNEALLERGEKRLVKRGNKEFLEIDPASKAFFWNRFPDNALIIIDEIQKYLSNIKEVGDSEEQSLVEYFSLHRHKRHDWIFLTQNLMSMSISVRRVSEKVVECLNSKSLTIPFPISIPLRDIQTLLLGFGIQNQVYRVREGRLDGSYRVEYDGPVEPVVMKKEIFDLYQTHTLLESESVGVSSDSEVPFDLGPGSWRRALRWFIGKHWFHLSLKATLGVILINLVFQFFEFFKDPTNISNLLTADIVAPVNPVVDPASADHDVNEEIPVDEISENSNFNDSLPVSAPIRISRIISDGVVIENGSIKELGSLTVDGRLVEINPRFGLKYENPQKYYFDLFDEPARFRRWMRFQQRQTANRETADF